VLETAILLGLSRLWLGRSWRWPDLAVLRRFANGQQRRLGPVAWSALVAVALMVAASLEVAPALHVTGMGAAYAELATDPFGAAGNPVHHRILTPLIAHLAGLRGEGIIVVNLAAAALLLLAVHLHFLRRTADPGLALLAAAALAFSLVTLTTVHYGGYTDSLTYLLIFLIWWARRRAWLLGALFLLALFNRESTLLLVPWFLWVRVAGAPRPGRALAASLAVLALATAIYTVVRTQWLAADTTTGYGLAFYVDPFLQDPTVSLRRTCGLWTLGLITVFGVLWAIPLVAAVRPGPGRGPFVRSAAVLLGCGFAQLLFAVDTSRMWTVAFPVMILALRRLAAEPDPWLERWAPTLVIAHLLLPQLFTAFAVIEPMLSPLGQWLARSL